MRGGWRRLRVRELAAPIPHAVVGGPFGSELVSADYADNGVPVIRGTNLSCGRWVGGAFVFVSQAKAAALANSLARPDDLVFTQRGTLGQVAVVPSQPHPTYLLSQSQMKLTPDPRVANTRFLYYLFSSAEQRARFEDLAIRTGVPHINLGILRDFEVLLPSISEQRSIAEVLSALDDKIELNTTVSNTLLEHGVVALELLLATNGAPCSEGGAESWRTAHLKSVTRKIGSGSTPRGGSSVYLDEGTAFIRSQNIHDGEFRWDGLARISAAAALELSGVAVMKGDVLINITGDSILRCCAVDPSVLPARVSQHVAILRPGPEISTRYLSLFMLRPSVRQGLLGMDTGATRQAVTKAHLEQVLIPIPPEGVMREFSALADPMMRRGQILQDESRTLAELRDTLLPKLLSGALRVRDAEKIVGEVT